MGAIRLNLTRAERALFLNYMETKSEGKNITHFMMLRSLKPFMKKSVYDIN